MQNNMQNNNLFNKLYEKLYVFLLGYCACVLRKSKNPDIDLDIILCLLTYVVAGTSALILSTWKGIEILLSSSKK